MVVQFVPARLLGHTSRSAFKSGTRCQSPFATDLFLSIGSTGSKQTLNGLFYVLLPTLNEQEITDCQSSFLLKFSELRDNENVYL